MKFSHPITLLSLLIPSFTSATAQNCSNSYGITCPPSTNFSYCEGPSLSSNIIFRCINGCPEPGNCNDDLALSPPIGDKTAALCWEDSSTAGDAQCTFDSVAVVALNGSSVYPVSCDFVKANATSAPTSVSLSLPSSTRTTSVSASAAKATSTATGAVGAVRVGRGTLMIVGLGLGINLLVS